MKIKNLEVKDFKRFHSLAVSGLPDTAKLVVLLGPNGCGKSSLFDAIKSSCANHHSTTRSGNPVSYYGRFPGISDYKENYKLFINFHGDTPQSEFDWRKAVYILSAYRNTPSFEVKEVKNVGTLIDNKIIRMIDNIQITEMNYRRLLSNSVNGFFDSDNDFKNVKELRDGFITEIKSHFQELFPNLILNNLVIPFSTDSTSTFRFTKGKVEGYSYENLSSGEKGAFDLLLDILIKRKIYDDTVFCIDEPESHISMKVQGKLLKVLYKLIPEKCQLWIATHSIGMMREAQKIQSECPDEVVFLDFDKDFDEHQIIVPSKMDRNLWEKIHSVALEDLSELISPEKIVVCESTHDKQFDANCYNNIFSCKYPNVRFVSVGSCNDVKKNMELLSMVMKRAKVGTEIIPLRDRDDMPDNTRNENIENGTRVLSRREIEDYLIDDEVLKKFADEKELSDIHLKELKNIKNIKKTDGDAKIHAGLIFQKVRLYNLLKIGNNKEEFLQDVLAPLITDDMDVYKQLEKDIFGE